MKPLISIITPTYNHEDYIEQCIESVQGQLRYKNWELLVIDDHSSDSTVKLVRKKMKEDKRIKLIMHKKNWGIFKLGKSYNEALIKSKGDLIAILEGDDYWPEDKLISQVPLFIKNKKAALSYGKWNFMSNKGRKIYTRNYRFNGNKLNNIPMHSIFDLFLTLQFDIASSTVLIKKNPLMKIGGFKSHKYYPFVDIPTYLSLACMGEFVFINKVLGCYRRARQSAWIEFANKSNNMGKEGVRICINDFVSKHINKSILTQNIISKQDRYLLYRKYTSWMSMIFNYFIAKQ